MPSLLNYLTLCKVSLYNCILTYSLHASAIIFLFIILFLFLFYFIPFTPWVGALHGSKFPIHTFPFGHSTVLLSFSYFLRIVYI